MRVFAALSMFKEAVGLKEQMQKQEIEAVRAVHASALEDKEVVHRAAMELAVQEAVDRALEVKDSEHATAITEAVEDKELEIGVLLASCGIIRDLDTGICLHRIHRALAQSAQSDHTCMYRLLKCISPLAHIGEYANVEAVAAKSPTRGLSAIVQQSPQQVASPRSIASRLKRAREMRQRWWKKGTSSSQQSQGL